MARQSQSVVEDGLARVRAAVGSMDREWKQVQKRATQRRRAIEKELEKRLGRLSAQLQDNPLVERAHALRESAQQQLGAGVESVLGALQIASKSDLDRIDRKLSQLVKKLKELEKREAGASA